MLSIISTEAYLGNFTYRCSAMHFALRVFTCEKIHRVCRHFYLFTKIMKISSDQESLISKLKPLLLPWRKMTIAIDGVDGSGKSTLSRFLAWQLGMPAIETDTIIPIDSEEPKPESRLLNLLINSRHERNRPLIVEGVFVLCSLGEIGVIPEILIRV